MTATPIGELEADIAANPKRFYSILAPLLVAADTVRQALNGATIITDPDGTTLAVSPTALGPLKDALAKLGDALNAANAFIGRPDGLEVDLARIRDLDPATLPTPTVLDGIPAGLAGDVFEVALNGACHLDPLAIHAPYVRNVIAHALRELYREGWLSDHASRTTLAAAARAQQATAAPERDPVEELIEHRLAAADLHNLTPEQRAAAEPGPAYLNHLTAIARQYPAVAYDADDNDIDRAATIIGATRVGLIPVASHTLPPRAVRGTVSPFPVTWPLGAPAADVARAILAQHQPKAPDPDQPPVTLADVGRYLDRITALLTTITNGGAR